jgi:surface antigen
MMAHKNSEQIPRYQEIRSGLKLRRTQRLAGKFGIISTMALALLSAPESAKADSGGYPWADAEVVNLANYDWGFQTCQTAMAAAGTCNADNRIKADTGVLYHESDPWRYDVRNCTSYVAWRVNKEFGVNTPSWGDASNWDSAAHNAGYKVSGIDANKKGPEAGDIAQWDSNHVAFVESVNADGSVNVAEYNHDEHGNFDHRGEAYDGQKVTANHYIDINGVGDIWNGVSNNNSGSTGYSAVPENGLLTDGNWVYDKVGGSAWPIKPNTQWTSGDANYWGGNPASVSTTEVHDHEVGYDQNGRDYGAHPPIDGTAVKIDGSNGDVYDFVGGNAYKIGSMGELAILGITQVKRIPGTGNRLDDFIGNYLRLTSGTMYRFADSPQVKVYAQQPDGSNPAMLVPNETSLDCFESVRAKGLRLLPDSAQQYLVGQNGSAIYETGVTAGCSYPGSWVENAPGSQDRWYIAGDGYNTAYQRHYYPNSLSMYVDSGGSPTMHTMRSADALNTIGRGQDMSTNPHAFFRNSGSGDIYWWGDDQVAHKVTSMDSLSCMGGPNVISVPPEALIGVPEGNTAQCQLEGKLVHDTSDGSIWFMQNGQRHYVLYMAIVNGLEGRVSSTQGRITDASDATVKSYNSGANAFVPYGPPAFLKYAGDPSVWLTLPDGTRKHAMSLCGGANILTVPTGEFDGHVNTGSWSANPTDCTKIANGQNIN